MWYLNVNAIASITIYLTAYAMTTSASNGKVTDVTAMTGQSVNLECGYSGKTKHKKQWNRPGVLIAMDDIVVYNKERISSVDNLSTLTIKDLTTDDEGKYTCEIDLDEPYRKSYYLHIVESECKTPNAPLNGGFIGINDSMKKVFYVNDKIKYFCHKGYQLNEEKTSTCTYNGWTGDLPICEPECCVVHRKELTNLNNSISKIESQLSTLEDTRNRLSDIEKQLFVGLKSLNGTLKELNAIIKTVINNQTDITIDLAASEEKLAHFNDKYNNKLKAVDVKINTLENISLTQFNYVNNSFKCFHDTTYMDNNCQKVWENFRSSEIGHLSEKDGSSVSEFTWVIKNIEEKIAQRRAKTFIYLKSSEFYTQIPGHRGALELNPDDKESGCLGVYFGLRQGRYDNVVPWPLTHKYNLTLVSKHDKDTISYQINPTNATCSKTTFEKPQLSNDDGCGFAGFIKIDTLLANKDKYLNDGAITIKFTMFLN